MHLSSICLQKVTDAQSLMLSSPPPAPWMPVLVLPLSRDADSFLRSDENRRHIISRQRFFPALHARRDLHFLTLDYDINDRILADMLGLELVRAENDVQDPTLRFRDILLTGLAVTAVGALVRVLPTLWPSRAGEAFDCLNIIHDLSLNKLLPFAIK